jgi:endoglucanase
VISRSHPSTLRPWRLLALPALVVGALAGAIAPAGAVSSGAEAGPGHEVGLRPVAATAVAMDGTDGPFAGRTLYVDPDSDARREAAAARERGDERRARLLDRIGDQPQADWFGDWYPTERVRGVVRSRVTEVTDAGAYPVLVLYAIPARDCGGYSGGGFDSSQAYLQWVREVAAGIGRRSAAVVLEPDSLALMGCLSNEQRAERLAVLRTAVSILATGDVAVYLDGGHSDWHPASEMADRLRSAGVHAARGFALNVVNFRRTEDELAYGREVSERLGGGNFVVDTSRNGRGPHPGAAWCNPPGMSLGPTPRVGDTGDARADALLWIKRPGESDGACGRGEPAAGAWWPDYALGLAAGSHDAGG